MRRGNLPFTIWFHLLKEYLFSFLVSFLFFFFVFFVNQLILLSERALLSNIPFFSVVQLIIYSLPTVVYHSAPYASLVACLMAVGRLTSEHQMMALRATGTSITVAFVPFLVAGAVISVASFFVNDYFLPIGTSRFVNLYVYLFFESPELVLRPYSVTKYQDAIIITGGFEDGIYDSLFVIDPDEDGNLRTINAISGELNTDREIRNVATIQLNDVQVHTPKRDIQEDYEFSVAENLHYNFLLGDLAPSSVRNPSPSEMSVAELRTEMAELEIYYAGVMESYQRNISRARGTHGIAIFYAGLEDTVFQNSKNSYENLLVEHPTTFSLQLRKIEFQSKLAVPFACLFFIFLSFPLGLLSKRSGRSVGFGIGLLVATAYWGLLVLGRGFGLSDVYLNPFIAVWTGNILVVIGGTIIFLRKMRQ